MLYCLRRKEGGAVFPFVGIKQQVNINFCFKLWKTVTETWNTWNCLWKLCSILHTVFQWLERFTDPEHDPRHSQPSRNSCSLWSIQFWPTAASTLTGSHELMPKDHPMTLILTKYQLQINLTIHHIVIWHNCEDCGKRTICFEFIPLYLTDETSTQSHFARTSSMPIWPPIHNFLIVSLVELSLGQFCTILKQNVTPWNGEQNHCWWPRGFIPTDKDQNNFFDKRCDALRICAWWKNSEFYVKTESDFKSGISILREMLLVRFARQCSYSCCHDKWNT